MLAKPDWKRRAVPLIVWGDGGAFTKAGNSIMLLCVAGLLMADVSWKSVFPVSAFCKFNRARKSVHGDDNDTWDRIWKYAVHGLNALFDGHHPATDPWGNAWPTGSHQANLAGNVIANGLFFCCRVGIDMGPRLWLKRAWLGPLQFEQYLLLVPRESQYLQFQGPS